MRKNDIAAAHAAGTILYYSESGNWEEYGSRGDKVKVVDPVPGHWLTVWENGERSYVRKATASDFYRSRTREGYLMEDSSGSQFIARAATLRGTWEECMARVTASNAAKRKLEQERQDTRDEQARFRGELKEDFGLYISDYDPLAGQVTVNTVALLELLRRLSS